MAEPKTGTVDYDKLVTTIAAVARRVIPEDATVAVVSRGDDDLLQLDRRTALHFPQDDNGKWAGYHPSDGEAAIAMLDQMREQGAEYFLLPSTAFWWLDYYEGLKRHLQDRYRVVERGEHCWIVELSERRRVPQSPLFEVVTELLPSDTRFAVLSSGAERLGGVDGRRVAFVSIRPSFEGQEAIDRLDALRAGGIHFVVISHQLFDWMEDHPEVVDHLRSRYRFITRQNHLCEIYEVQPVSESPALNSESRPSSSRSPGKLLRQFLSPSRRNGSEP